MTRDSKAIGSFTVKLSIGDFLKHYFWKLVTETHVWGTKSPIFKYSVQHVYKLILPIA